MVLEKEPSQNNVHQLDVCIYQNPLTGTGCETRSVFNQNNFGLNSELPFSKSGYQIKAKGPSLPNYLYIAMIRFCMSPSGMQIVSS